MFQYSNLWNYGPEYGADWNLTIDIKCVDLTDDSGICSAGLHNCDEQGFCLDHHSVVLITDEEIDHLGSGFSSEIREAFFQVPRKIF